MEILDEKEKNIPQKWRMSLFLNTILIMIVLMIVFSFLIVANIDFDFGIGQH